MSETATQYEQFQQVGQATLAFGMVGAIIVILADLSATLGMPLLLLALIGAGILGARRGIIEAS